ncbi:MAG: hypothetical protein JF887_10815 [Candidatus Dormibacteraeota bacterium]|uniref:Glycosyltransferase RgtA/B/C/D-like domain-containing protein n=1 Tax=Candidatus Amunia macphersoniae TaxID=3127014 RepID=A0A934KRM2_9BACT|nr:hypothetical protein [Candidatus Dormibacteraeota bacterium]
MSDAVHGGRVRGLWGGALAAVAILIVVRNLTGLDSAPLGAYTDETSIGYNAWAISSHAVDEHGAHLPLYFTAFGEYKNPIYIYTLSALLRVLPLTITTERLPAALFGLITCACTALIAWRRSRSMPVTVLVLVIAGLVPWLTVESRVGFEVVSMVAAVSGALLCLSIAQDGGRARWYVAAGILMAAAVFAYSTGRVEVALFAIALAVAEGWRPHCSRDWVLTLAPIAAAYALLAAWSIQHPGALTARFSAISIAADGAPALTVAGRFAGNYLTYLGPDFLFIAGDHNPRHNTQLGGMLLWVMLPLLAAGIVSAWRRRDEPFVRLLCLGALLAPVSAALTEEGVPHSLRAAVMLPFLLLLCAEGAILLAAVAWRRFAYLGAVLAVAVQGSTFTVDMLGAWPTRSALAFDVGEIDAMTRASALAGGSQLLVSQTLDEPYVQAAFALRPAPPRSFVSDSASPLLAEMNIKLIDASSLPTRSGAIAVLAASDPPPAGGHRLFDEAVPAPSQGSGAPPHPAVTVVVYRLP